MNAIDDVIMCSGLVGVTVDEGGVAMFAQEIIGCCCLKVGVGIFIVTLTGFADFPHVRCDGASFGKWFGEQRGLPGWIANLVAKCHIRGIIKAQRVTVREHELPFGG